MRILNATARFLFEYFCELFVTSLPRTPRLTLAIPSCRMSTCYHPKFSTALGTSSLAYTGTLCTPVRYLVPTPPCNANRLWYDKPLQSQHLGADNTNGSEGVSSDLIAHVKPRYRWNIIGQLMVRA